MNPITGFAHVVLTWQFATTVFMNCVEFSAGKTLLAAFQGFCVFCSWSLIRYQYRERDASLLDKIGGYNGCDPMCEEEAKQFTGFGS